MCESCNDQSYLWTTGCNDCGVSSTTHTFDQLYSNYYNKLSKLSGNKFLPGSGSPQNQFPPIDLQYSHYLDILTGNFYLYNITTDVWDFTYVLPNQNASVVLPTVISGTNINVTQSGLNYTVNAPNPVPSLGVLPGTGISVNQVGNNYVIASTAIPSVPITVSQGTGITVTNSGSNYTVNANPVVIPVQVTYTPGANINITAISPTSSRIDSTAVTSSDTLQSISVNGATTDHTLTMGGAKVGTLILNGTYTPFTDSSNFYILGIDTTTMTVSLIPRQQVISGGANTLPPTTGNFMRGDIYIAG